MQLSANPDSDKLKKQIASLEQSFQPKLAKEKGSSKELPASPNDVSPNETSVNTIAEKKS